MSQMTRRNLMKCFSLGVVGAGIGFVWPRQTEAEMTWDKIMSIVSDIGEVAETTKDVVGAIEAVKGLLPKAGSAPQVPPTGIPSPHMQPFHAQIPDTLAGGRQWLPELQSLAAQHGNAWVPRNTQGFLGVDLTGIWGHPQMLNDQTYIRQFGPYLNVIAGVNGVPTFLAEGLFDPKHNVIHVLGLCAGGAPCELRAQVFADWTLRGVLIVHGPTGQAVQHQIGMVKLA